MYPQIQRAILSLSQSVDNAQSYTFWSHELEINNYNLQTGVLDHRHHTLSFEIHVSGQNGSMCHSKNTIYLPCGQPSGIATNTVVDKNVFDSGAGRIDHGVAPVNDKVDLTMDMKDLAIK